MTRDHAIAKMDPIKVKKELNDYASMIQIFGPKSTFVKEKQILTDWQRSLPSHMAEELQQFSGWGRCESQKCFTVSVPGDKEDLEIRDDAEVTCLKHVFQRSTFPSMGGFNRPVMWKYG